MESVKLIVSFANKATRKLFESGYCPSLGQAARSALRKLRILHATTRLESLRIPSGNRLESLKGNRAGQYSIRVNDHFRICFMWENGNAYDVEVVDYH